MNAITLLEADHQMVKKLLNELESTTERGVKTRSELFATIKGELTLHEIVEEEIFYPELKAHPKAQDIVLEAYEEHHVVDVLMGELEALDVSDETWGAKAKVMKENIEHHIEEEEGEMFRQGRARSSTPQSLTTSATDGGAQGVGRPRTRHPRFQPRLIDEHGPVAGDRDRSCGFRIDVHGLVSVRLGTSGFLYDHWRGRFYPPSVRARSSSSTTPPGSTLSSSTSPSIGCLRAPRSAPGRLASPMDLFTRSRPAAI